MSTRQIAFMIKSYDLVLVNGQLQSRNLRPNANLDFLKSYWDLIVEELERRVIPFQPLRPARVEDVDPWRHAVPGFERMAEAEALLATWRKRGLKAQVESGSSIKGVDLTNARTFLAPAYLKPELLWLLREEHSNSAHSAAAGMRSAFLRPGGVA